MTIINSKALRAVVSANFAVRGGLIPVLFITVLSGGLAWSRLGVHPGVYTATAIWYLAMLGAMEGIGFRLTCAPPRAWLVPGLREHSRLVRFTILLAVSCAVAAGSAQREAAPALLGVLWLGALAGFYVSGLSRHLVATMAAAFFGGALLGLLGFALAVTGLGGILRQHRDVIHLYPQWAALLLLNIPLTIWIWRRILAQHDHMWIRPGTGAFSTWLEGSSRKQTLTPPRISRRSSASFGDRVRLFHYNARPIWRNSLSSIFIWSCVAAFLFRNANTYWSGAAFGVPLAIPMLSFARYGMSPGVSARMFMLPLQRSEIIRCWGTARFIAQLREWPTIVLPFTVAALLKGVALPTVFLALGATLAAQLPIFALLLWVHSRTTASGIRYTVFLGPVLSVAALFLPGWWTEHRAIAGTILLSLPLGLILIWLAYRRWLNTEVGTWASWPTAS